MKKNNEIIKQNRWIKTAVIVGVAIVVMGLVSAIAIRQVYNNNLKPRSGSSEIIVVEIPQGYSAQQISSLLEEKKVISQSWAFDWYVRTNGLIEDMKAGTYALRPSLSVQEVVNTITDGEITSDLVTIIPGRRLDQVRVSLINSGFDPTEVEDALNPDKYTDHPALVDKPKNASLEGYLYPESFKKDDTTTASDIVQSSLDEMQEKLTPSIRSSINKQGLSVYEGIILASIIEQEVPKNEDRPVVASVFLNRLDQGIKLQSDATASYGAILDDAEPTLTYSSDYNTYEVDDLPPTPISNFSFSALQAVANPAKTDFLYFVSGDDGETYFSKTLKQHEAAVEKYCKKLCS